MDPVTISLAMGVASKAFDAIKKGFATIRNMDTLPTEKFMKDESKIWKPFRTVASLYLWKITDDEFEW